MDSTDVTSADTLNPQSSSRLGYPIRYLSGELKMDAHIRTLRKEELLVENSGRLDGENADRVISWLVAAENRRPVIFVGAGFTLNAYDRRTGRLASTVQAPLWSDVVFRLAKDLGVSETRYDAPTLFEMYGEHLRPAKLRDALRATVADSDLIPGKAHDALVSYRSEAIITLNCLDTVLDKACASGWRRIVVDEDLSAATEEQDLIYLHGHRFSPDSWVMTRSQFEDFSRRKPVILARVRQLMAQHPWILVGFSLTDPNFHAICRLLGREMQGHQPLSLALMREAPLAAERHHWHRLGFEIASPVSKNNFDEYLTWIFPKLETTYSPSSSAAKGYVERAPSASARLKRFREVNPVPVVDKDATYKDWRLQLESLLKPSDQAIAREAAEEARRASFPLSIQKIKTEEASPNLELLNSNAHRGLTHPIFDGLDLEPKFRPLSSYVEAQWIAIIIRDQSIDITEHFAWAVENRIFEANGARLPLEIIAIRLAERSQWHVTSRERFTSLIQLAYSSARKYGRDAVAKLVFGEALRLDFPAEGIDGELAEPHLQLAREGLRASMNAKFAASVNKYREAARLAGQSKLGFEEWVYTVGQEDAERRLASRPEELHESALTAPTASTAPKGELELSAIGARRMQLEKRHEVERWISRANASLLSVLQDAISSSATRDRFEATGGWGRSFGSSGHALWRAFRDLESIHAPPSLLRQYLEPLVPLLDHDEFAIILRSGRKPREWLEALLGRPDGGLEARQARDAQLSRIMLIEPERLTKSEVLSRLECLQAFDEILRTSDVSPSLKWIEKAVSLFSEALGETATGSHAIAHEYWPAFTAAARWSQAPEAMGTATKLLGGLGDAFAVKEGFFRSFYSLPWSRWSRGDKVMWKTALTILTELLPSLNDTNQRVSGVAGYALFTLLRMFDAGLPEHEFDPFRNRWNVLLAEVRRANIAGYSEARRAGFLLEWRLAGEPKDAGQPEKLFEKWFGADLEGEMDRREELWATILDVVDKQPSFIERLRREAVSLVRDDVAFLHYRLNPGRAYSAIALLSKAMVCLPRDRGRIGKRLLQLVVNAPEYLAAISIALVSGWWEAAVWSELLQLLLTACGGGGSRVVRDDPGLPTRRQLGVLELFGRLRANTFIRADRLVWLSIQSFALAAISDRRVLVANHAAYSVVNVALTVRDPAEAALYASAVQLIAMDSRVGVRSALADAGPNLEKSAKNGLIRSAASEGVRMLSTDGNAQVAVLLAQAAAQSLEKEDATGPGVKVPVPTKRQKKSRTPG